MKRNLLVSATIALIALLFIVSYARSATVLFPVGGGTGRGTLTSGQLIYGSGTSPVNFVATTTLAGTGPISVSNSPVVIGASGAVVSCAVASGSQPGCLASADWTTFNNKQPAGTYVTTITVASSNGFAGSSSGGATPALTLTTTVTGLLKGNGTAISAAVNGTDFTLVTAKTCTSGDFFSAMTAAGVITCATPSVASAVTSIGPAGQLQTGPAVTLATSSTAFHGLTASTTITGLTNTLTFANTLAGILDVGAGGTGLTSVGDGKLVYGNSSTALTSLATSTGSFLTNSYTTGRPVWAATSTLNIALSDTIGTLLVPRGGTGQVSFTSSQLLYGNGTNALTSVATTTLAGNSQVAISNSPVVIGGAGSVVSIVADSIGDSQLAFDTGQNLTTVSSPTFAGLTVGSASGVVIRTSGVLGTGVDGTDFTLTNAITCSAGDFISAVTAAGVSTCSTPSGGGGANSKWATSTLPTLGIYPNSAIYVGIGTTTPRWPLQLASSTVPQFTLSDGSLTSNHWSLRNAGGNLYIATSSPSTFATSSLSALSVTAGGFAGLVGIGTSTPFVGALSIESGPSATTNTYLTGNLNNFLQLNIQNRNSGSSASSDLVATADNGSDTTHFIDLGINSSGGGTTPFTAANAAYLYSMDDTLSIGALGSAAELRFFTAGGIAAPQQRMTIDVNGRVGIASSTPWALLSVASSTWGTLASDYTRPLFSIATSSDQSGDLFSLFATTSSSFVDTINPNIANVRVGVIVTIGKKLLNAFDSLVINGPWSSTWVNLYCDDVYPGSAISTGIGGICGFLGWVELSTGTLTSTTGIDGDSMATLTASSGTGTDASILRTAMVNTNQLATTTPRIDVVVGPGAAATYSTTTARIVGFTVNFSTTPAGCYVIATTTTNWQYACESSVSNVTLVDSGIPTSTPRVRFRVELFDNRALFYGKISPYVYFGTPVTISSNLPTSGALAPDVYAGRSLGGTAIAPTIDVYSIRFQKKSPWFQLP